MAGTIWPVLISPRAWFSRNCRTSAAPAVRSCTSIRVVTCFMRAPRAPRLSVATSRVPTLPHRESSCGRRDENNTRRPQDLPTPLVPVCNGQGAGIEAGPEGKPGHEKYYLTSRRGGEARRGRGLRRDTKRRPLPAKQPIRGSHAKQIRV